MDERSLKNNIRKIRENLNFSQDEFALELGIDSSTYWRLEEGKTNILCKHVYRIAAYAGISVDELVNGRDTENELRESGNLQEQLRAQREYYEDIISSKDLTIKNLNAFIDSLRKD